MKKKIRLSTPILNDEYIDYVCESFDIAKSDQSTTDIEFDVIDDSNWNIGLIVGNSGSGKTTILREFGDIIEPTFDNDIPLISNFKSMSPQDATMLLTSIGLSSVPTWLRPFNKLSNGEQYRAKLAYSVSSCKDGDIILIDEYTSVVDRDVAKAMSFALQKYIRKHNKKIILASCHYDVIDWLMPDWTISPQKGGMLERHEYLRQGKPKIELSVSRVEIGAWDIFKKHHYLTEDINLSCKCLLFKWDDKPVGFIAMINQPTPPDRLTAMRISRVVVLPDYQGLGLGVKISEFSSAIFKANGASNVYIKTVNPALGEYMERSHNWKATAYNGKVRNATGSNDRAKNRLSRRSYNFEYVGDMIDGYSDLLLPLNDMRLNKSPFEFDLW
jgi:ABC-type lipoprotein export system ATPase subunit